MSEEISLADSNIFDLDEDEKEMEAKGEKTKAKEIPKEKVDPISVESGVRETGPVKEGETEAKGEKDVLRKEQETQEVPMEVREPTRDEEKDDPALVEDTNGELKAEIE